jgi:hypothetical protein
MDAKKSRTTVSLNRSTKARLDRWRANGQCYDGFLCQLISLWEQSNKGNGRYGMESFSRKNPVISRS